jgi:MFS family permease
MRIHQSDLDAAATDGVIDTHQAGELWRYLQARQSSQPGWHVSHLLYYLGGLIAIAAMSLFVTLGWELLGGWGIMLIAALYIVLAIALTEYLLQRRLSIPAGLTAALAVALTPLLIYGLQQGLGWWDNDDAAYRDYHRYISWRWLLMELATLAAGAIVFWRYRQPFLLMPVALTLWYLSMDLAPFLFDLELTWELRRQVSMWFGLAVLILAFALDLRYRRRPDYGFWFYLFGMLAFWCGLTFKSSDSELAKFLYFLLNLALLFIGTMLRRRVFTVFGGLGVAIYLGYLAYEVFEDSLLFPVVLSFIGLGVIGLGILWQRHEAAIGDKLRALLPGRIRDIFLSV